MCTQKSIVKMASFMIHHDALGQLIAIEGSKDIPFDIKRVYYILGVDQNAIRGHHAHKTLKQLLICVHGSCKIRLDDGVEQRTVLLNKPNEGLFVSNVLWREMFDFSSDAVLLVLASDYYNETDYIRDYGEFLEFVALNKGEEKP